MTSSPSGVGRAATRPGLVRTALVAVAVAILESGCGVSPGTPRIATVSPARAFTDHPVVLRVGAMGVRPSLKVNLDDDSLSADLQSVRVALVPSPTATAESPTIPLETVDWDGQEEQAVWARTPAGLPPGRYAVELTDPRGQRTTLAEAFESLGSDLTAPAIALEPALPPDSVIGAGDTLTVHVVVDDGEGAVVGVLWNSGTGSSGACPSTYSGEELPSLPDLRQSSPSLIRCEASFMLPVLTDQDEAVVPFVFRAETRDRAGHAATLEIPLRRVRPPIIASFSGKVGALAGGQPFVVRGRGFLPGTQAFIDGVLLGGGVPGGELRDDPGGEAGDQKIEGLTPPARRAGMVRVQVRVDRVLVISDPAFFVYVGPPRPREAQPAVAPRTGGTLLTIRGNDLRPFSSVFVGPMGAAPAMRVPLYNPQYSGDNKIVACVPPGSGTMSVWVVDPITGEGILDDAFTYQDSDGGASPPFDPACR